MGIEQTRGEAAGSGPVNLADIRAQLDAGRTSPELQKQLYALVDEAAEIKDRARRALLNAGGDDLRPALRTYLRGYAKLHGRTASQQIAAFIAEDDKLFSDLQILAWGIDLCS